MSPVYLADVVADARPGFASGKSDDAGYVQVRMNNVSADGDLSFKTVRRVPKSDTDLGRFAVEPGDILFNATNSPELVGKSALFTGHSEPVVYSNHFLRLRLKRDQADPAYVSRWLRAKRSEGVFTAMCKQWVNQAAVEPQRLLAMALLLPPLPDQRRIAAILDQADALRAKRRATLAQLDEMASAIFMEMFGTLEPESSFWPRRSFEELAADIRIGLVRASSETGPEHPYSYIKMDAIGLSGNLDLSKATRISASNAELDCYLLRQGDFLFNTRNSRELVGKSTVYRGQASHLYNNNIMRIRFKKGVEPEYVLAAMQMPALKQALETKKSGTTSVFAIYWKDLKTLRVPLPPAALQVSFAARLTKLRIIAERLGQASIELQALFASLQHRAFAGEL